MKKITPYLLMTCLALGWNAASGADTNPSHQKAFKAAEPAAAQWFALIDAGKYAECWEVAAPTFKKAMTQDECVKRMKPIRQSLGVPVARMIKETLYNQAPPLVSRPDTVVFITRVMYTGKRVAEETVALYRDPDDHNKWKVTGSFIRPINFKPDLKKVK